MNKSNNILKYNFKKLSPFKFFVLQNFPFIAEDFDSLTYYELLCKLAEYLNKVIDSANLTGQEVEQLSNAYIELKNYVDNYFSDLNVQEQINNKLDEMAESGQLADIINVEIFEELNNKIDNEIENRIIGDTRIENNIEELDNKIENIKNMLSKYDINLDNHIIYDLLNTNYNQGMTIDNNGNMYIYINVDDNIGNILVFNIDNFTLTRTISNVQFYHGGDIVYKNGYLYAIANNIGNTVIIRYNLTSGERVEFNPFLSVSNYNTTLGISDFDENNLLCLIGYRESAQVNINNFGNCAVYKINITDWNIEQISLHNLNNYYLNYYAIQSMEYLDDRLYIMVSEPNMILEFIYNNNSFDLNKIYNIPRRDNLGLLVGELEGISIIRKNSYGEKSFMITTVAQDNENQNNTIKSYMFNFDTEIQNPLNRFRIISSSIYRNVINCNSSVNNGIYYENGTDEFPFKNLRRAVAFVNYSPYRQGKQISIKPR